MRRTVLLVLGLVVPAGCSDGNAPMLPPVEASFTGYIGGGGRAAESDSTGASVTGAAGVGMIGGGRSDDESSGSAAGVLVGSGH
jgi:hypothetical protein